MLALVAPCAEHFLSHLVSVDVRDHAVAVEVRELDRECLECMAFRHVVFDSLLELFSREGTTTDSLVLVVRQGSRQQIAELIVPISLKVMFISTHSRDFVFQDLLEETFFLLQILQRGGHNIADARACRERFQIGRGHAFPHVLIFQFPACVHNSVVGLHVCKEVPIIETAPDCAVESVHSWVAGVHLLASQRLPEVHLLFALLVGGLTSHDPGVRSLRVGPNTHVGIEAKAEQQIAKQHSMVFRINTSLRKSTKCYHLLWPGRLALSARLQPFQRLEPPVSQRE